MIQANVRTEVNRRELRWLVAAFVVAILLQLELVFNRPINWDEFLHLSETHAFAKGEYNQVLQILYARLFFWVPSLPLDAIGQMRVVRLFMFACELVTTAAIFAMGRRFAGPVAAACAALAYLTGGYVFQHGFSYRADPLAAALLMGSLWILFASRLDWRDLLGAALLAGLAVLATIKVVFYAPAFAAVAWWRWQEADYAFDIARRFAAFVIAAILASATLVGLILLSGPGTGAGDTLSSSSSAMFSEGLFPRLHYIGGAMVAAPVLALLVLTTPLEIIRAKLARNKWLTLAGLMLPLASVLVYRNSFPYFYAFILPPVMVAVAVGTKPLLARVSVPLLVFVLTANAAILSFATPRGVLVDQQRVVAAVHQIFPRPVAYFDFPGMISDFPKANFFMSTWGMHRYWDGDFPTFAETMQHETVPLMVINQDSFQRNQTGDEQAWEFLPEDGRALREAFIPHWGPLWVAGRRFPPGASNIAFRIYAPGTYTLEGAQAQIDGRDYIPGDTVALTRDVHQLRKLAASEALLRWGDHLPIPAERYPGGPVFQDF